MHVDFTGASPDALAAALARGLDHLMPPLLAVRDHGCRFIIASQSTERFDVPRDRPSIVIIGDDLSRLLGPAGFHARSLKRYLTRCKAVAIVSSAPVPEPYAAACSNAVVLRQDVAIIETRPEHEADWYDFIRALVPEMKVVISTVAPQGTA